MSGQHYSIALEIYNKMYLIYEQNTPIRQMSKQDLQCAQPDPPDPAKCAGKAKYSGTALKTTGCLVFKLIATWVWFKVEPQNGGFPAGFPSKATSQGNSSTHKWQQGGRLNKGYVQLRSSGHG